MNTQIIRSIAARDLRAFDQIQMVDRTWVTIDAIFKFRSDNRDQVLILHVEGGFSQPKPSDRYMTRDTPKEIGDPLEGYCVACRMAPCVCPPG